VLALLSGCDQQAMLERFIPKEEAASATRLLSQLAAKDYESVESQLDPSLRTPSLRASLEEVAAFFPSEDQMGITTIGAYTNWVNGVTSYELTFEHQYPSTWLVSNVVLQRRDGQLTVMGVHVSRSLKEINRFTFEGKSALHYLVFALAIAIPLFIVATLVVCFRTPIGKEKWLWVVFVAVGLVQFSLNWTDGSYQIQPISFSLLGAGYFRAGPYAPLILTVALPIGAIVFLVRRKRLGL
jgi:hypothetical protein